MDTFVVLKFLSGFIFPPASLALAVVVGIVLAVFGLRRLATLGVAVAVAETLVLAMPPVGDAMLLSLQDEARAAAAEAPACCYAAIVVLGGGIVPAAPPELPDPSLTDSADRVWHAARLYHRGLAPEVIVTGGSLLPPGSPATTEAEAMRRFLIDLGVPATAIVAEGEARNTVENIRNVRRLVGDGRVALVTSAYHMPRALQLARRANLAVGAFPTDWYPPASLRPYWETWMPTLGAMQVSTTALRERLAMLLDGRRG
ncbi:YdcF family protein [Reyranella sp.]|uniref:YdcF family protein n=1 Tax=Reyranella sp. TaxID=1929291 RepID=UPI003BAB136E